jgi:hypothetical protein
MAGHSVATRRRAARDGLIAAGVYAAVAVGAFAFGVLANTDGSGLAFVWFVLVTVPWSTLVVTVGIWALYGGAVVNTVAVWAIVRAISLAVRRERV